MANLFDKFLNSMKLYEDDEEFDDDDLDLDDEEDEIPAGPRFGRRAPKPEVEAAPAPTPARRAIVEAPRAEKREAAPAPRTAVKKPSVVNVKGRSVMGDKSYEVCMIRPTKLDDAREICETLLSGRAVVINMEGVHVDLSQRIIDFTSGACFAVQGNLQKISKYIFIVSPASIDLTGDFQETPAPAEQDLATLSLDF